MLELVYLGLGNNLENNEVRILTAVSRRAAHTLVVVELVHQLLLREVDELVHLKHALHTTKCPFGDGSIVYRHFCMIVHSSLLHLPVHGSEVLGHIRKSG